jgi:acetoin utilization deacetylase AcuC-like enzyme
MTAALVWHERMMWFDSGTFAGPMRAMGWVQPGEASEDPEAKRRIKNLLDAADFTRQLLVVMPDAASEDDVRRVHSAAHVEQVKALSANSGGQLGYSAFTGPGGYEIALLAAGATMSAMEAVLSGKAKSAYALVRPPGHHADGNRSMGFCIFNNIAVAIRAAQKLHGVGRVAIVDWDVHHGNGTQTVFYDDPSVLAISMHQESLFPQAAQAPYGAVSETGQGPGEGATINIPLPPGSGTGAYRAAFDRVVLPALRAFKPDMIFVACGLDAGNHDALGRMVLGPEDFRWMTKAVMGAADDLCGGRLVLSHEGGYHAPSAPFLALPIFEELVGKGSGVENAIATRMAGLPVSLLLPHQEAAVEAARAASLLLNKRS